MARPDRLAVVRGAFVCWLLTLSGLARAQETRLALDPAGFPGSLTNRFTVTESEVVGYFVGHVTWSYEVEGRRAELMADRAVVFVKLPEKKAGEAARGDDVKALKSLTNWTLYAEAVRLEIPSTKTVLEARTFLYEHATQRGLARNVRLRSTVGLARAARSVGGEKNWQQGLEAIDRASADDGVARSPIHIQAEQLRLQGLDQFEGVDVDVSTCEFGLPHLSLGAQSASVTPVTEDSSDGAGSGLVEADRHQDYIIDPEGTYLRTEGREIVPFPVGYWDTRWQAQLPIREVDFGHSGQFGWFGEVNWNLNYFLNLVPPSRFLPLRLEGKADLGFHTAQFEKRGFGYGPNAEYGSNPRSWGPWQLGLDDWRYHGEAEYFRIDDHGDEDRSTRLPVPEEQRFWGHVWHRQAVPYLGLFDLEYSQLSDRAFLGEYYERIFKEEKEQETLAYWRRNLRDNLAVTGLYSQRVNDFQSQTEREPEGKLYLLQQPIFETGFYTDLNLQAAYLHKLEDDRLNVAGRGFRRADILNEWAYPVHWLSPYLEARPFAVMRYTEYGEVLDEAEGSEGRATFGAGVAVSQHWSRVHRFDKESISAWLLGPAIKHSVSPKVTYLNLFANDLRSEETIPVDAVDTLDVEESVTFSLRNEIFSRSPLGQKRPEKVRPLLANRSGELATVPHEMRRVLDSEVSFALFPRAHRDNNDERSSLLIFDNTLGLTNSLGLRAWLELDPNRDFRAERTDLSLTWDLVPGKFSATLGERLTRERSDVGYGFFNWTIAEKWVVDMYYARDFEIQRDVEYKLGLSRILHRMAVTLEYSLDVGEDRNSTVYFSVQPVELLKTKRHRYRR